MSDDKEKSKAHRLRQAIMVAPYKCRVCGAAIERDKPCSECGYGEIGGDR